MIRKSISNIIYQQPDPFIKFEWVIPGFLSIIDHLDQALYLELSLCFHESNSWLEQSFS